ncbi:glycosyl hydrolase 108 family protein [Ensifer adhaerens]|uniref:glycosyl hydrolase 108 family protein n=1 Tax=Ensifer adhaerens TaxID=106592 RepID=UPI000CF03931|nr:glycosyl hydrolase 108 family protein [Ensifer adhaerens]
MPQIPTYTDQLTPQGSINAAANGSDFGSQIGQATQQLGGAMATAAENVNRVEEDKARIWAYDAAGKQYTTLKQQLNDHVNSLDPNDPGFTAKVANLTSDFEKQVNDATQNLVNSAPNRIGARVVASHMATNGRALINSAMGEQARITGEYTGQLVQDGIKQDQDQIAADPSNDNFKRIVDSRSGMLGSLSTVDPVQKMKWQDRMTHALAVTQVQSLAAVNPQGFLSMVNAQGGTLTKGGVKGAVPGGGGADFNSIVQRTLKVEGGYSATDGNSGAPVNFGINQRANPDIDVKNLTKDQAVQLYKSRYWDAIGGDSLPAGIRATAFDAAVNQGVPWTKAALQQAGGDVAKFNQLREQRYRSIVASDPSQGKYLSNWLSRIPGDPSQGRGGDGGDLPQVAPLDDHAVANASPDIAGWGKLTWAEKVSAVRQAESAMGSQLASERGELQRQLKDAGASLLAGKDYPGLDDPRFSQNNLVRVFGPDEGRRASDQLQYAKQVGGFIGQMATMPNAQAQAMLQTLAPEGGDEYASKAPVFKQAVEAYTRLQKLRNDDYMAWARTQPRLNAQPMDFTTPQAFGRSLGQRIGVANAGRTDYGADAHLLSQDEASQLGGIVSKLPPQDQMAYLKQVRQATQGHDDWFTDTLSQIAPKNTMLAVAAATSTKPGRVQTAGGAQSGDQVGQYILEGAHILQGKDIDDPQKTGRPLQIDDNKIRTMFWTSLGANAFASPDAQHSNQLAADTYQAVKNYLVADMYHRGMTPDKLNQDLVQNAITAVTGGSAKQNGSTLFMPWGMAKSQFQTQFPWALDAALQKGGIKGTKLDAPDAYQYSNVGDGKYLVMTGNKALVGANGRSVIVDMSRPQEGAGAGRGLVVPETNWYGGQR